MDAHIVGKFHQATAAIAAHAAFAAIGIIIFHFKIITCFVIQHHQSICTNAKTAVAQMFYLFCCKS